MNKADYKLLLKKIIAGMLIAVLCSAMAVYYLANKDILMAALFAYGGYELTFRARKWLGEYKAVKAEVAQMDDEVQEQDEQDMELNAENSKIDANNHDDAFDGLQHIKQPQIIPPLANESEYQK